MLNVNWRVFGAHKLYQVNVYSVELVTLSAPAVFHTVLSLMQPCNARVLSEEPRYSPGAPGAPTDVPDHAGCDHVIPA